MKTDKTYNFTMIRTLGNKKPDPCIWLPRPTILTPNRKSAEPAKEFPSTLNILEMYTGNPFEKITLPRTPKSVIRRIGFMKIDFMVWMTTRHFPLRIFRLLLPSDDWGHLIGDVTGLPSLFLFCKFVISIITYPMGLSIAREIGAIR